MRRLLLAAAPLFFAACVSSQPCCKDATAGGGAAKGDPPAAGAADDAKTKLDDATVQVEMAETRLKRAQMDCEQQKRDSDLAQAKAQNELQDAQKALDHFVNVEMPAKLARSQLDLQQATDSTTEQEEELQQLELMYKNDDLGDKTKEIVIARTKRRLERAHASLALQKQEVDDLMNVQLPDQRRKLELTLKDRQADLERAQFNARTGEIDKQMAVRSQQIEVEKQRRELEKLKKSAAPAEKTSSAAQHAWRGADFVPSSSVASFVFGQV